MTPLTTGEIAAIRQRVGGEPVPKGFAIAVNGESVLRLLDEVERQRKAIDEVTASIMAARTEDTSLHPLHRDWLGHLAAILTKP